MKFKRPCRECDELFRPEGKEGRVCKPCKKKLKLAGKLKRKNTARSKDV